MAVENHGFTADKNVYNLTDILNRLDALENSGKSLSFDKIYPVGSIYITTANVNPGTYFTGTVWERYAEGRTIFGQTSGDGDFNNPGKTGGSKTQAYSISGTVGNHKLTTGEIPKHIHDISNHKHFVYYEGSTGSDTDYAIYQDYDNSHPGQFKTNVMVPYQGENYGGLFVWKTAGAGYVSKKMKTSYVSEGNGTSEVGGDGNHNHPLSINNINTNKLPPYITCYIWRRKA